jgi:hypothetical protein
MNRDAARIINYYFSHYECATVGKLVRFLDMFSLSVARETVAEYLRRLIDADVLSMHVVARGAVYCLKHVPRRRALEYLLSVYGVSTSCVAEYVLRAAGTAKSQRVWIPRINLARYIKRRCGIYDKTELSRIAAAAFEYVKELVPGGTLVVFSEHRVYYVVRREDALRALAHA